MQGNVVSPRGIKTMELRPGILRLTKPQDALPTRIGRTNLSAAVAAAESLQLVAGRSHPQLLFQIAPSFRNYTNDVGEFDGAYGPRLDWQMPIVIDRLRRDEYTRQAIAIVYDHDDIRREESKDYPCTLSLHFLIRDGKVCLHTTMRSNDI
jgi:thymidylate synthase